MKKRLAIITVAAVILCACVLAACSGGTHGAHTHTASSFDIIKEATCEADGEREGVCSVCGKKFTETVAATGHDWHLQSEESPTCTEDGKTVYACANCFETEERTVDALGHDDGVIIPEVPALCETVGWTEGRSCSRCGTVTVQPEEIPAAGHEFYYETRSNDTHAVYCENCNYSEIADCEFEEIEILPTCTQGGKLIHTCKVCGDTHEHQTAEATGHLWTENWSFYKTVDGVYKHRKTCYKCEAYLEEECLNIAGDTVLPKCETVGYTEYACDGCKNAFNSDFKEKLGHDFTDYELDDMGADPYAHTHKRRCLREDCGVEEKGVSVGTVGIVISVRTDETCLTDAYTEYTCSLDSCSYAHTETYEKTALGHSFGEWEYSGDYDEHHTHTHRCLRTGCLVEETSDCRMVSSKQAATCTKPEIDIDVCEDCFYVDRDESPALGHTWGAWINVRDSDGKFLHSHACTVCGFREYGHHSYETSTVNADCEHDEAMLNICSVCAYTVSTAVPGTALGHDWKLVSSDLSKHSLVCSRDDSHTLTAAHDYDKSNICPYDGEDGLTYELSVGGDYYIVKNDNGLGKASEITVPSFRALPNSSDKVPVRAIGKGAFYANLNIAKVNLPATVTAIEESAFANCPQLTTVSFYDGDSQLTAIDNSAFSNCGKLSSVTLSENLTYIGSLAFLGCTSLREIEIPESVCEIGTRAFYNSGFYNDEDNWENGALYAGRHLIKVSGEYFTADITDFIIKSGTLTVSEFAFENCTGMIKVTVPSSIVSIDTDAFKGCINLRETVYGGSVSEWFSITFVSTLSSPMYYATHMDIQGEESSELILPANITSIPAGTFKGNTNITKVTIPASVTSIGDEAFMDCSNLAEILFEDDGVSYMGKDAFTGTAFSNNGSNWADGVLILSKHILATNGEFTASEYVVAANIRTISAGAFADRNITHLTVGASVVRIGAGAFNYDALESVTFESTGSWMAKNSGGAVRSVSVTGNAAANATLLKNYTGDWRKA